MTANSVEEEHRPRARPGGSTAAGEHSPGWLESRAADPARWDAAFLAETTRCLAESLDYEATLAAAARLALPILGSWCIVDVVEPDQRVRRLAIVHPDPDKESLAAGLMHSWPPSQDDVLGVPCVMASCQVEVIVAVDEEMLAAVARDETNLQTLRALGIGSVIVVPLIARDSVLGAITLVSDLTHRYSEADIVLAEDLGARCAMAIDNARLYRDARHAGEVAARMNERLVVAAVREQELSDQAQAANAAKSSFLSAVSHEIRTPLNALTGYAELLELEIAGPLTKKQREYLTRIKASGAHLIHLIEDILDLAKVEAGRLLVHEDELALSATVSEAISLVVPLAAEQPIELAYGGDEAVRYRGDADRARQILVNLLSNAVKFTAAGGNVSLRYGSTSEVDPECRMEGHGPWAFVRVVDSGAGIAPEMREKVFEPFVQVERRAARPQSGTGLGLAISRELARRMGGDVTLRSAVGEGSCFTLWLPAAG